jgi:uncharacterized protein YqfA (UPF0365 family)
MKTILLIAIWIIVSISLWLFAVATKVDNEKFKHHEFRIRSVFYWLSVILSFLIGCVI